MSRLQNKTTSEEPLLLSTVMMNGKTLAECTGEEVSAIAKFYEGGLTVGEMVEAGHMKIEWAIQNLDLIDTGYAKRRVKSGCSKEAGGKKGRRK